MHKFVYTPPHPENTNLMQFGLRNSLKTLREIYDRADSDPDWFWPAIIKDIGIEFFHNYSELRHTDEGIPWTKWFVGGTINITYNCIEKRKSSDKPALKFELEDGLRGALSFKELDTLTGKLAGSLKKYGIVKGDRVGIYMPPSSEAVIALYAIMRVGAVAVPMFSGYGKDAVSTRIKDADMKLLFTTSSYSRRGKKVDMLSIPVSAGFDNLVVHYRNGDHAKYPDFYTFLESGEYTQSEKTSSEDPAIILYTSGTTGKPKGTVHVHGGTLVNVAKEVKYYMDCRPDDTLFWISDLGWMMGPWSVIGSNALGAACLQYEGAVDYPHDERLWQIVENNDVTLLGLSPTLVRSLKSRGLSAPMKGVRAFGSTGEPWDDESWMWLFEKIGEGKVPICNISGGTDIIGCFLASTPAHSLIPKCLYRGLGMQVSVYDDAGNEVFDRIGYLVSRAHIPSMTRGIWRQPDRYISTYWSRFPNVWFHGDWAMMDRDGYFFLYGRSDDVIKVAGKRVGPNEVENLVMQVSGVTESAVIGIPDSIKGEAIAVFFTGSNSDDLISKIKERVEEGLGKSFSPKFVLWLPSLPKTRNGKIVRRVVRSAFLGKDPGDVSNMDDLGVLQYITELGYIYNRDE
ncbi:MAG: AMP-binding protein [Thermoplasmataceae archaeon]